MNTMMKEFVYLVMFRVSPPDDGVVIAGPLVVTSGPAVVGGSVVASVVGGSVGVSVDGDG